jgi:hypothetical protein
VFEYELKLRYPNGRIFTYTKEGERPPGVGDEFDAFGRRWRIAGKVAPTRLSAASLAGPETFACEPLGESGPRTPPQHTTSKAKTNP